MSRGLTSLRYSWSLRHYTYKWKLVQNSVKQEIFWDLILPAPFNPLQDEDLLQRGPFCSIQCNLRPLRCSKCFYCISPDVSSNSAPSRAFTRSPVYNSVKRIRYFKGNRLCYRIRLCAVNSANNSSEMVSHQENLHLFSSPPKLFYYRWLWRM